MGNRVGIVEYQNLLDFWFVETDKKLWFKKDPGFDNKIRQRFYKQYNAARSCELFKWRETIHGRLAEIIILDQFSRNLFRNSVQAFSNDALALGLAQETIASGLDQQLNLNQRAFLYMPFMHSESRVIHQQAVELFSTKGLEDNLRFELKHKAIIEQFGRYPHRNKVLGRQSTQEEIEFLKLDGSSF